MTFLRAVCAEAIVHVSVVAHTQQLGDPGVFLEFIVISAW